MWANTFAVGLLGLSLALLLMGCFTAILSSPGALSVLVVVGGLGIGGVVLLALADGAFARTLPRPWARRATVAATLLLLLSWLILLVTSCSGFNLLR
jgi:hypothetical protein